MTKAEIVAEIARRLGAAAPPMSTGSTEPRAIFEVVNQRLGLGLTSSTKQGMAREIVESIGGTWFSSYESRGATVTRDGLLAVLNAVRVLTD